MKLGFAEFLIFCFLGFWYVAEHIASPSLGEVASRQGEMTEGFFLEQLTGFNTERYLFARKPFAPLI